MLREKKDEEEWGLILHHRVHRSTYEVGGEQWSRQVVEIHRIRWSIATVLGENGKEQKTMVGDISTKVWTAVFKLCDPEDKEQEPKVPEKNGEQKAKTAVPNVMDHLDMGSMPGAKKHLSAAPASYSHDFSKMIRATLLPHEQQAFGRMKLSQAAAPTVTAPRPAMRDRSAGSRFARRRSKDQTGAPAQSAPAPAAASPVSPKALPH